MPFENLVAPEPRLDATLNQGHAILKLLNLAHFTNPALYANPVGVGGNLLIPEVTKPGDESPWLDTTRDLAGMGLPLDKPIYLQFEVGEFPGRFFNVAQSLVHLQANDPIYGLASFISMISIGATDPKVLAIIANLPGAKAALKAELAGLGAA